MKILMCNSFYYLRGGAERCFLDLIDLLESHGHEVIPFAMTDERNRPSPYASYFISHIDFPSHASNGSGIKAKLDLATRVIYFREAKQQIEALIEATKPDIAHIHGIAHETSPSILTALKQANIPVVQTLHDYKLLCPNTSFVSREKICERCKGHRYFNVVRYRCKRDSLPASLLASMEMYVHKALQIYEKNVDLFITPSQFLQRKLAEYKVPNPIAHIPNFINVADFQPCYEPENYFVYSGRLVGIKGVKTLFAAMRQIKESHLYVAGAGDLKNQLEAFTREQGISNVTFLGHLNTSDLIDLVQRALFTVVPSEWYENYPMTVLESFACGTPVIGAKIGGIPELIQDGENGLLFESGNVTQLEEKIRYLLRHREQTIVMGRNGRRQVEQTNAPESHYQKTIQVYQQLIQNTRSQSNIIQQQLSTK